MGKNSEIKFVGQPIFKQILSLLDNIDLNRSLSVMNRTGFFVVSTKFQQYYTENRNNWR